MSIYAYVGLPGSGKSYNVVENQILPALKEGRKVVTNIPLYEDRIREVITTGEIVEFPTQRVAQQPELIDEYATPGCVLVLDEVWRLFPAGQKVNHVPEPFKRLLAEHRHMVDAQGRSMQIVLVTQDLQQIGAFARQLVEQTFLHKKLSALGMSGSFSCTIYRGPVTGQNPPQNLEIRTVHGRYSERIWRYYKSHTMSQAAGSGANEASVDTRGVVWKRPIFIFLAVLIIGTVVAFPVFVFPFFDGKAVEAKAAPGGASVATAAGAAPTQARPAQTVAQQRVRTSGRRWRVAGFIDTGSESIALLQSSDGLTAMMDARGCQRSRYISQCKFEGEWVRFEGLPRSYPEVNGALSP